MEQASVEPVALADLNFDDQAANASTATVAFVSDDLIAVGRHPSQTAIYPVR
jgi:hypothetical protein